MTTLLFAMILLGGLQSTPPAQTPPAQTPPGQPRPNPCDAAEYRHFDFWIGNWEVKGPAGQTIGNNVIEPLAGNCGVHENWKGARGGSGRSLNTYVRTDGKWHQVWVGTGGGLLHLIGGLKDGAMVLEGPSPGPNGTTVLNRVTWTPMPKGLRQHWETSNDAGKTWTTAFDGFYSKRAG